MYADARAKGVFAVSSATYKGEGFSNDAKRVVAGRQAPSPQTRFNVELGDGAINQVPRPSYRAVIDFVVAWALPKTVQFRFGL